MALAVFLRGWKGTKIWQLKCKDFAKVTESRNTLTINVLQYPLFCVVKEPVLHDKSAYIATQNRRFCNAKELRRLFTCVFFTK